MEELQFKVTGVEPESPVANSFWRFSPSRPRLLAKRLRPWRQYSLSNSLPTGVRSFGGADFCSGKEMCIRHSAKPDKK